MIYTDLKSIMLQIEHIMLDNNIRQKDICNATGWSAQTVSNLLACRRDTINIDTLAKLCNALGYNLDIEIKPRQ